MPEENILVIAVDGLRAASLGAYGNTSFSTPALDELAADSYLFDACYVDAVELPQIYQALWQSVHPQRGHVESAATTLPRLLSSCGYATTLVTDEPTLASFSATSDFDELVQLTATKPVRAADVSQTSLAQLFTTACDEMQSNATKRLIWLHARGFYGPWDAPLELQEPLLEREEGDPPPSDDLEPPDFTLDSTHDPDTGFRWNCAYAAQAMVLDACLEALRETLADAKGAPWLVVLLGVRGFPLGEHGRVGGVDGRLYSEQLHVPMLWRFPDGIGRLARSGRLSSHLDLVPTLLDWIGRDADGTPQSFDGVSLMPQVRLSDSQSRSELIAVADENTRVIRTKDWTLRRDSPLVDETPCELFVRPDDRWEANDVAALCPDVVDDLTRRLSEAIASIAGNAKLS